MILLKNKIDLTLRDSGYLKSESNLLDKVIQGRKYRFAKDGDKISIERVTKDGNDWLGGELYKLCPIAKGKISEKDNGIQLNLKVGLLSFFKWILFILFLMFGITIYLAFDISFEAGRTMSVLSAIICLIPTWLFYGGLKNFKKDLKEDLEFLDSNKS